MQPDSTLSAKTYRFGVFEVDLRSGEVRKAGTRIRIQGQPFEVLAILLTQPGEVVTREELQKRLWPTDIFVDFDHGVNTAINKLRVALSDTADTPRYIETLPRRGYRFIAPVVCEEAAQPLRMAHSGSAAPARTAQVVPLSLEPDNGSQQTQAGKVITAKDSSAEPASSSAMVDAAKQHRIGLTVRLPILFLMLATASYGVYSILNMKRTGPFETFMITQVTNRQGTVAAAISPDGKYLLSVLDEHGKQSLWLRHLQTNSDTQVIAPSNTLYGSLEFSPDGSYFYFRKATDNTGTTWNLLRAPVLGGAPQLITRDVDTAITFSPDGRRIAFMRSNDPEVGKFQVIVAHADGTPDDRIFAEGPRLKPQTQLPGPLMANRSPQFSRVPATYWARFSSRTWPPLRCGGIFRSIKCYLPTRFGSPAARVFSLLMRTVWQPLHLCKLDFCRAMWPDFAPLPTTQIAIRL
jgi:DNA-binding winged helix-turn-helix (wHTH) protein